MHHKPVRGYTVMLHLAFDPEQSDPAVADIDKWDIESVFDPMCEGVQLVRAEVCTVDLGVEPECDCGALATETEHRPECEVLHPDRWLSHVARQVYPNKASRECGPDCLGWDVFERNSGERAIERCDSCQRFDSDADACWHVVNMVIASGGAKLPGSLLDTSPGRLLVSLASVAKQLERGKN